MVLRIFILFWLVSAAVCYCGFYWLYNRGRVELPPQVESMVTQPIGMLLLLVVFLVLGPAPITAIKIERRKPGESRFEVDVNFH